MLNADIVFYKANDLKTISLLQNDSILKKISFNKTTNSLTYISNGKTTKFEYNWSNKLTRLMDENKVINIGYFEDNKTIKFVEVIVTTTSNDTIYKTSIPYKEREDILTNERFIVSKINGDTINLLYKTTVINQTDNNFSYTITKDYKTEYKRYYNGNSVTINKNDSIISYDSVVKITPNKNYFYQYTTHSNFIDIVITKDSVYKKKIVDGRMVYEKVSYNNKDVYEREFYTDSSILSYTNFVYFPDKWGKDILWKKTKFNANGKIITTVYPNKIYYKLKKGVLCVRKKEKKITLSYCRGSRETVIRMDFDVLSLSPTLILNDTLKKMSFDIYGIEDIIINFLAGKDLLNNEVYFQQWKFVPLLSSNKMDLYINEKEKMVKFPIFADSSFINLNQQNKQYKIEVITQDDKRVISPFIQWKDIISQAYYFNLFIHTKYLLHKKAN